LLKQALVNAKLDETYHGVAQDTVGVVFLGTPHRGSAMADLGSIAASIAASAMPGLMISNPSALRTLRRNSDILFQIAGQFSNICKDISIHSFHETVPMSGTRLVRRHNRFRP